jgi:hypothetical protein
MINAQKSVIKLAKAHRNLVITQCRLIRIGRVTRLLLRCDWHTRVVPANSLRLNGMFHGLRVIVFVLLLSCPAHAEQWYAGPNGDDANDCLTVRTACKTAQGAVQKMPLGRHDLHLAPGVYDETIDVSHGRQVSISGPIGAEGSCPDMNAVTIRQFWVQDNATIWVWCLSTGQIACRQWSIADLFDVRFFGVDRTPLEATETCRINTARALVLDSAFVVFARAQNYSTINLAGDIVVAREGLTSVAHFVGAIDGTVDLSNAKFSGHPLQAGKRFYLDHGVLVLPPGGIQSIPGTVPGEFVNLSICRGSGIHGGGDAACEEKQQVRRLDQLEQLLAEKDTLLEQQITRANQLEQHVSECNASLAQLERTLQATYDSRSWKVTGPLRNIMTWLRR